MEATANVITTMVSYIVLLYIRPAQGFFIRRRNPGKGTTQKFRKCYTLYAAVFPVYINEFIKAGNKLKENPGRMTKKKRRKNATQSKICTCRV